MKASTRIEISKARARVRDTLRHVNRQNARGVAEVVWFLVGPAPEGYEREVW